MASRELTLTGKGHGLCPFAFLTVILIKFKEVSKFAYIHQWTANLLVRFQLVVNGSAVVLQCFYTQCFLPYSHPHPVGEHQ